jgi:sRNA-binding regulator protein Hfq
MDQVSAVREDQVEAGRQMAATEGTLHAKPGYNRQVESRHPSRASSNSGAKNRPMHPKKPHTPKGHDAILARLQQDKTEVEIGLVSGVVVQGVIVGRDKFTITVGLADATEGFEGVREATIYKSGIEYFGELVAEVEGKPQ